MTEEADFVSKGGQFVLRMVDDGEDTDDEEFEEFVEQKEEIHEATDKLRRGCLRHGCRSGKLRPGEGLNVNAHHGIVRFGQLTPPLTPTKDDSTSMAPPPPKQRQKKTRQEKEEDLKILSVRLPYDWNIWEYAQQSKEKGNSLNRTARLHAVQKRL